MRTDGFHPAVEAWFAKTFAAATAAQVQAWPAIRAREHVLVAAPTGSGKTLAAFLAALDDLVRRGLDGSLTDETQVVYVSPLKALSNDIERNLQVPLAGIRAELAARGLPEVEIRVAVRTGDTPARERAAMVKRPPHIVVTTPESLYILLTSERGREMLRTTRTVIVDEIHAVVGSKRGSHLALSLERLAALTGGTLPRIGLSATQRPIEAVARFLVGNVQDPCTIVDLGHVRALDLAIEVPGAPLETVMANEVWEEIFDRLAALIQSHRTTLVFVNTRRLAERVTKHLSERLGSERITSHHGSLARDQRLQAEQRLKRGELVALVATSSLELGIDIGDVDLVCQLGSTRSIATFLQRVGRSGHAVGALPKGRIFPLSRDELVEAAALFDCVRRGELDRVEIPFAPLDILAQQLVATLASEEWTEDDLFALVRRAEPYRDLDRARFDDVVRMLAEGFSTRRGRRSAYVHRDAVNGRLRGRRGARLAAITGGGAIPDNADYQVLLDPAGTYIGTVHEDFAVESTPGDIFQLGNTSWRILRVEPGRVRVADAQGQPPTLPFWLGEAPSRTRELSQAVSRLRAEIAARLDPAVTEDSETRHAEARAWLASIGVAPAAARQLVDYLALAHAALGTLPTQESLVLERFFDESGGMQLVLHAPFGGRVNRAWGLALRKRFCRKFNFELQAAANEDALVLSLGPTHSFPLAEVFDYLRAATARDLLTQALLDAPMFEVRWRWNCNRALAVPRFRSGRRVPPPLQRMQSADLLTVVFPDQVACAENLTGAREIPDHPLVAQTIHDCLHEAMDIDGLEAVLAAIEAGEVDLVARDVTEPSPLAQEILNGRPYTFLDDAPLEERRTQAVLARRWLDPDRASDIGALDPEAIERVRDEAWPTVEDADELHDALVVLGFVTVEEGARCGWTEHLQALSAQRRATVATLGTAEAGAWVAAERLPQLRRVFPALGLEPAITAPANGAFDADTPEGALVEIVRGRLEGLCATTAVALAADMGLPPSRIDVALVGLESEGFVLRGRFTPGATEVEWCERRLLARMHRYTLKRLRAEIEPVTPGDFLRFLLDWQHVTPSERLAGPNAVGAVLEQLEGFAAAAIAWEDDVLAARIADYEPAWLDAQCQSGRFVWVRLVPPRPVAPDGAATVVRAPGPVRSTPIGFLQRRHVPRWDAFLDTSRNDALRLSPAAQAVDAALERTGAAFFDDIAADTGLLRTQIESALAELVAAGRLHADSFLGLRALLVPASERRPLAGAARRRRRGPRYEITDAGRWVLRRRMPAPADDESLRSGLETLAQTYLRRYGVVFRKLIEREAIVPPWRDLLRTYHRMEARGDIRGGRFVAGFAGEQFALPTAVAKLREVRRAPASGTLVSLSAADPLNLVGLVTPDARVPALAGNRVLYRDGAAIAVREGGEVRILAPLDAAADWQVRQALVRRIGPPSRPERTRIAVR